MQLSWNQGIDAPHREPFQKARCMLLAVSLVSITRYSSGFMVSIKYTKMIE